MAASDPDPVMNPNSVISFSVVTSPGDVGLFDINSTTVSVIATDISVIATGTVCIAQGVITLLKPLDREERTTHVLTVIAQNQGLEHVNYTTVRESNYMLIIINATVFRFKSTLKISMTIIQCLSLTHSASPTLLVRTSVETPPLL